MIVLYTQLYNSGVTAIYQLNYDYYANELCENQDKPELHCDGKCYFARQLAKEQNNAPTETEPPALLPTLRLFSSSAFQFKIQALPIAISPTKAWENEGLIAAPYINGIDHPPQV